MKRKKFELEWFVYVYGFNSNGLQKMNIFNHFEFEEYTIKHLKECSTKVEFAERISRELFYYFGSKCEYELIITRKDNKITLSPWMGNNEGMPNITPHVCRHTYCSNMAKSGMNPKTLQYLMGHSDISVTMNVYTHISFDDAEEELRRMEEFRKRRWRLIKGRRGKR